MTAKNFTPISSFGAAANAATFNGPYQELDDAIGDLDAMSTTNKLSAAGAITEVDGNIDALSARVGAAASVSGTIGTSINTDGTIKPGVVGTTQLANGAVGNTQLANDSVDDTKVGNRVPALTRRQGGSASDWSTGGMVSYTPTSVVMQAGAYSVTMMTGVGQQSQTISFPTAFSAVPLVFFTLGSSNDFSSTGIIMTADSQSVSQVVLSVTRPNSGADKNYVVNWLAIGPA